MRAAAAPAFAVDGRSRLARRRGGQRHRRAFQCGRTGHGADLGAKLMLPGEQNKNNIRKPRKVGNLWQRRKSPRGQPYQAPPARDRFRMLSVIIATLDSERALVRTLAALVPGATAGLVSEVVVADAGSHDDTAAVADIAGCNFLVADGPLGQRLKAAAAAARAPWLLFLRPGTVLDTPWIGEVRGFRRATAAGHSRRRVPPRCAGASRASRSALAPCRRARRQAAPGTGPADRRGFLSADRRPFRARRRSGSRSPAPDRPAADRDIVDPGIPGQILDLVKYMAEPPVHDLRNCRTALPKTHRQRSRRRYAASTASTRGRSACCARPISTAPTRSARRGCCTRSPTARAPTASEIGRALDLDAGYLSRTLRNFEKRGLIERKASASDARQSHLALSPRGRQAFAPLERRSQRDAAAMLARLKPAEQARLIAAMNTIEALLGGRRADGPRQNADTSCARRSPAISAGSSNATPSSTAQEYGWTAPFEGVCAQIVADFVNKFDRKRERCWIAEIERRECRLDHAGEGDGRASPASACCWSTRRRAGSGSAPGSSTNASASPAAPATRR